MNLNPAASQINLSEALSSSYSGSGRASEPYKIDDYGANKRAFAGTSLIRTNSTSSILSSTRDEAHAVVDHMGSVQAEADQATRGTKSMPAACESLGSSDTIELRSTSTASVANAIGKETKAEDTHKTATLSASANTQTFGAEKIRTVSRGTVSQGEATNRSQREGNWKFFGTSVNQNLKVDDVVEKIDSGQLWVVNSRRRNGIIVMREFHAEFAGPGAAVGGDLDSGIVKIIPIGNLSLLEPDSHEEHQNAIKIRLQWIRLTQNFTDQASPDDRARMILEQF
ncbi:MAG: hypothetical protein AAFP03_13405 [Cyanobacteria bacterium J06598_3]